MAKTTRKTATRKTKTATPRKPRATRRSAKK